MHPDSSSTPTKTTTPGARAGVCQCGVPVVDHFDSHNRMLVCDAARRRWQARLAKENDHREMFMNIIAMVWCVRLGRTITTTPALGSLEQYQQDDARLLAQLVLTLLDPERKRVARERGLLRGIRDYRQVVGRPLTEKDERDLRVIFGGVINDFLHSLQGLLPITDLDIARLLEREAARARPATVVPFLSNCDPGDERRAIETAAQGEGQVQ